MRNSDFFEDYDKLINILKLFFKAPQPKPKNKKKIKK